MPDPAKDSPSTAQQRASPQLEATSPVPADIGAPKPEAMKLQVSKSENQEPGVIHKLACLAMFMIFGPSLIMINKHILRDLGYSYPITHTFYTSLFCSIAVWVAVPVFNLRRKHAAIVTPQFYMRNIMPIGFLQGSTVVLGMSSYLYLTVSFVQMLKAATPVMIVVCLHVFNIRKPSGKVLAAVLGIAVGTLMSGYGELNFNIIGVVSMLSAQFAEALKLALTEKLLKNLKFDVVESLCYIAPAATFWVFLAALILELPKMDAETLQLVLDNKFLFLVSGLLAIGVNTINSVVIKFTGSLMMKLLATSRNASLVMFNVIFMAEKVSSLQFCGYCISLVGFLAYNHVRLKG